MYLVKRMPSVFWVLSVIILIPYNYKRIILNDDPFAAWSAELAEPDVSGKELSRHVRHLGRGQGGALLPPQERHEGQTFYNFKCFSIWKEIVSNMNIFRFFNCNIVLCI